MQELLKKEAPAMTNGTNQQTAIKAIDAQAQAAGLPSYSQLLALIGDVQKLGLTFHIGNAYIRRDYIDQQDELNKRISQVRAQLSTAHTVEPVISVTEAATLAQLTQAFLAKADYNTGDKLNMPCCDVPHALLQLAQAVVSTTNGMATAMAMRGDNLYEHTGHFVWAYEIEEPIAEAYLEILLDGGQGGFECIKKAIAKAWKSAHWLDLPAHFWETFDSVLSNTAAPCQLKA